MPNSALKTAITQPQTTLLIFDFREEKGKRNLPRFSCPICKERGEYCPQWVLDLVPGSEQHRKLSRKDKLEFLRHTTHLI